MIEGVKAVFEISRAENLIDLLQSMEKYMVAGHNIVVRAYLVSNMFGKDDTFFGGMKFNELVIPHWKYLGFDETLVKKIKN